MMLSSLGFLLAALTTSVIASPTPTSNACNASEHVGFDSKDILYRDVAVIGGGASGTYTAIRLRDSGKSVVLVEKEDHLGGHTETYTDPITGSHHNYGVRGFVESDIVDNYFARLNVAVNKTARDGAYFYNDTKYVDSESGSILEGYRPPNDTVALIKYKDLVKEYSYLSNGIEDLPDKIPEELLMPFSDYITKHGLEDAAYTIQQFCGGLGSILNQTTLNVVKLFNYDVVSNLNTGWLVVASGNNLDLYTTAANELGEDVLLSSQVTTAKRYNESVQLITNTPQGQKLIQAKKLVVAFPPILENFDGWDLDSTENDLFSKWQSAAITSGLMYNSTMPDDLTILNVANDTPYNLLRIPGPVEFVASNITGLKSYRWAENYPASEESIHRGVEHQLDLMRQSGIIPATNSSNTPDYVAIATHYPYAAIPPVDDLRNGFYKQLRTLQGHKNTLYVGGAWAVQTSPSVWAHSENKVLPLLLK